MKNYTFYLCSLIAATTSAQTQKPTMVQERSYIEVTGTAERQYVPDEIYVRLSLHERFDGKNKITIEAQEENLRNSLKAIGIPLANLKVSDQSADYYKIKRKRKDVITIKDYILLLHNTKELAAAFQEFDRIDIKEADVAKVSHSKIDSLRKEVRILAIKAAKEKADYLLNALGEKTGKPLLVSESTPPTFYMDPSEITNNSYRSYAPEEKDDNEISATLDYEKLEISFSIYVRFEIRPSPQDN
ncbi:MAG TPA: SIMPL domain-containing protein [Cytophagales bacterium]|nr:SIMPL domain-containing protein [Cytophagales bacterium]